MNDFYAHLIAAYNDRKDTIALYSLHVEKDRRDEYPESKHNERRPVNESRTGMKSSRIQVIPANAVGVQFQIPEPSH
jgi:hypothetical protein